LSTPSVVTTAADTSIIPSELPTRADCWVLEICTGKIMPKIKIWFLFCIIKTLTGKKYFKNFKNIIRKGEVKKEFTNILYLHSMGMGTKIWSFIGLI
jgi:hypothetical protein